jgi:DNA-binding CsgD family transcriptional regulator
MARNPDYVRKKFGPMLDKTLENALAHRIGQEFPRIGGPRIRTLCAELVLEVVGQHLRPRDHIRHGQVLWMAVSRDDPPARHKRIADTDLVPVLLDLSTSEDIEGRLERRPSCQRLEQRAVRLCLQAYAQGALLSSCDLAELLGGRSEGQISSTLVQYEKRTESTVPRRATLHDVGSGVTHKAIICRKRYVEGKSSGEIARETYHSLDAVDRYLGQYDRVRHCRRQGMSPQETAYALNCSLPLIKEYLQLDDEFEKGDS